jgi:hypothetical protein
MKLIHYSTNPNFKPRAIQTVDGMGKGCFFYPEGEEVEWTNRFRFEFWLDDETKAEFVQEFEAGEFPDVDHKITELFVRAKNLKYLR